MDKAIGCKVRLLVTNKQCDVNSHGATERVQLKYTKGLFVELTGLQGCEMVLSFYFCVYHNYSSAV